ncbi:MAG: acyltransferase [Desulfobacteraceae bacterium]|jgi:acetyltransferase-like isoleucine patch superfamily enzyme
MIIKKLIKLLQSLYWDISWKQGRYEYLNLFLGRIPGHFGLAIRSLLIAPLYRSVGKNIQIFPGVKVRGIHNLSVGNSVVLGEDIFLNANGGIVLEDEVGIGPGSKVWSVNHVIDDINKPITEQGYEDKAVHIGKGVWIGANCTILPGAQIGEGVVVSAGSVVGGKKIKAFALMAGNPARIIGFRKKEDDVSESETKK